MSLSVYSGRVDEHSHTESLVTPPLLPTSPSPLVSAIRPFSLIPGHKLRAGWQNSLSVPLDTQVHSCVLSQMKDGLPKKVTSGILLFSGLNKILIAIIHQKRDIMDAVKETHTPRDTNSSRTTTSPCLLHQPNCFPA